MPRALRISLIVFVVLAVLFIAADRIAVKLAESEAADKVRATQGVNGAESADVSIGGFPFLTQIMGKELDDVDVEIKGLTATADGKQITIDKVDAALKDVKISGNFGSAVAKEASGSADLTYESLNAIVPEGVRVGYAGAARAEKNQVKITATVDVMGRRVELPTPVYSTVTVTEGNKLQLDAETIPGSDLPGAEGEIRKRVDFETSVEGLPAGLELQEAEPDEEGVTFDLKGTDVELAG